MTIIFGRSRVGVALILLILGMMLQVQRVTAADGSRPPNIVFVLMDDMGWRDVGFMGNKFVETPNIDRLAAGGLVFSQAYASAPNCAPTRACLMSGQYTPRHGIYTVVDPRQPAGSPWHKLTAAESRSELATEVITLPEVLHQRGYATAFFGMWNLGRGRKGPMTPEGQGFDQVVFPETIGFGKDAYFDGSGNYLSDRLTDEVLKFIEVNREKPFFVYLADHAVHAPFEPKAELVKKYEKKAASGKDRRDDPAYAATIDAVDQNVGRIIQTLDKLKIHDNTLIVFTSDNGGIPQYTAPLRGSKGQLYEGGIRVPLVMSWARLGKPGRICDAPVSSVDMYPTLAELAGAPLPKSQVQDGVSLVSVMRGENTLKRSGMFWHFPCYVGRAAPASAVREGDLKLIEFFEDGGHYELYNLRTDPNEQQDLAKSMPEKANALYRTLKAWQVETGAANPVGPNPSYDPKADMPRGGQKGQDAKGDMPRGGKKGQRGK
jgi:arylsulfatase A